MSKYNLDKDSLYLLFSVERDDTVKRRIEELSKEAGFVNIKWIQAGNVILLTLVQVALGSPDLKNR